MKIPTTFINISKIFSGSTISVIIPFCFAPLLTRIYSPEQYGTLAICFGIIASLHAISCFRLDLVVVQIMDDTEASNIIYLGMFLSLLLSLILGLLIFIFYNTIGSFLELPEGSHWLYLIPFGIFANGSLLLLNAWYLRKKQFGKFGINKITLNTSSEVSKLVLGYLNVFYGLIYGRIIGIYSSCLVALYNCIHLDFTFKVFDKKIIARSFKKYKSFPLYNSIPALLDSISLNLPIFYISKLFNVTYNGYLDVIRQLYGGPLFIISYSISQTIYPLVIDKKNNKESIKKSILGIFLSQLVIAIIAITVVQMLDHRIYEWYFGKGWGVVAEYSKILIIPYCIRFIISPLSAILTGLEKIKIVSVWQILYFLSIGCLYFFDNSSFIDFLWNFTFIEISIYLLYFIMIISTLFKYESEIKCAELQE